MNAPTYDEVMSAVPAVGEFLNPTLLRAWPLLEERFGFPYYLKHENHQPTGAFKVRGGVYLLSQLGEEERTRGIIGCTTGNHGQSLAYAAKLFGTTCTLVVPEGNNPGKNASMRALGVELIEHGRDFDDAKLRCEELVKARGLRYVHSANEPHLIAGVGTMAVEIFDVVPNPDAIFVPIGLGSGVCGTAIVAANRNPETKIIGVQSVGAPAVTETWRSGEVVSHPSLDTFAEGLATRSPAELTMEIMRRLVHDIVLVTDEEIREAMKMILECTHNLPEPAGAATTAAAWKLREQYAGMTVVGILSGGNCDLDVLSSL